MLIISQAPDDAHFIFRGGLAAEFINGLSLLASMEVVVVLSRDRHERGRLAVTNTHHPVLVLSCEDLTDARAAEVFDATLAAHERRATGHHDKLRS